MNDMTPTTPTPSAKPKPRPRPQGMRLTDAAAARITELTKRADSEIVGLRVGCLDERAALPPTRQKFCASALSWTQDLSNLASQPRE